MARISGVDIPIEKTVAVSLTYIYGVGPALSQRIVSSSGIDQGTRVKDLKEADLKKIRDEIEKLKIPVEGELKKIHTQNIKRLSDIKSYRGLRHRRGLPTRGQKTRSNARTRKGKRKTVGGLKRKIEKT